MDEKEIIKKIKKKVIVIADEKEISKLPEEIKNDVIKIMKNIAKGNLPDDKLPGSKMKIYSCKHKLICNICGSKNVEWFGDKNFKEVYFKCFKCGERYWMTEKEYGETVEKNHDCIFE